MNVVSWIILFDFEQKQSRNLPHVFVAFVLCVRIHDYFVCFLFFNHLNISSSSGSTRLSVTSSSSALSLDISSWSLSFSSLLLSTSPSGIVVSPFFKCWYRPAERRGNRRRYIPENPFVAAAASAYILFLPNHHLFTSPAVFLSGSPIFPWPQRHWQATIKYQWSPSRADEKDMIHWWMRVNIQRLRDLVSKNSI